MIVFKKLTVLMAGAALATGLMSASAFAQSAKFAASWDNDPVIVRTGLVEILDCDVVNEPCYDSRSVVGVEFEIAKIHVAQKKSLLIGVSAQTGIYTMTEAKGKNKATDDSCDPGSTTSVAEGEVEVTVKLVRNDGTPFVAKPGPVVFDARVQTLSVSACTDEFVAVKLVLDTTAAHHFNFLGVELDQGDYVVIAQYDLSAFASVLGQEGSAQARAALGPRVITVQELRAVKDSLEADDDPSQTVCPDGYLWDATDEQCEAVL